MVAEQVTNQEAINRITGEMSVYEAQQAGIQKKTTDDLNATKKDAHDLFCKADAALIKTNRRIGEFNENGGQRGGGEGGYKRSLIQTKDFKIEKLDKTPGCQFKATDLKNTLVARTGGKQKYTLDIENPFLKVHY